MKVGGQVMAKCQKVSVLPSIGGVGTHFEMQEGSISLEIAEGFPVRVASLTAFIFNPEQIGREKMTFGISLEGGDQVPFSNVSIILDSGAGKKSGLKVKVDDALLAWFPSDFLSGANEGQMTSLGTEAQNLVNALEDVKQILQGGSERVDLGKMRQPLVAILNSVVAIRNKIEQYNRREQ